MNTQIAVSVVIVNYKSAAFTRECLRTIFANADRLSPEVIVVDNASFDGCGAMIAAEFPAVTFIQEEKNLGFAGANNLGAKVSRGRHILFLNPDTEIQGPAIETLVKALESTPDAGMVGAHLLNTDLTVQTSSITAFPSILNQILGTEYLRTRFPRASLWGMRALFENHPSPVAVDAISGACMLIRRDLFEQICGFTIDYFMYAEDLDLCLKVRKSGRGVYYVPGAVIVHHGGQSSSSRPENNYADIMIRQSVLSFMRMYRGSWYAWLYRFATGISALCRIGMIAVTLPVSLGHERKAPLLRAWRKWSSIFSWCLGIRSWASRERMPRPTATNA